MSAGKLINMKGPKQVPYTYEEFSALEQYPGGRDSKSRASRAEHLYALDPAHTRFEGAEFNGKVYRITGNTRHWVWKMGLSDYRPEMLVGDIYECTSMDEVQAVALKFDSPEAAWHNQDYAYSSIGLAFKNDWRPSSWIIKQGRLARPLRLAEAYVRERYTPDRMAKVELITPKWKDEIVALDSLLAMPFDDAGIRPFKPGTLCGFLLLLRYESKEAVAAWIRSALNNEGIKDTDGMDATQCLVELFKLDVKPKKGKGNSSVEFELVKKTLFAFEVFNEKTRRAKSLRQVDPLAYIAAKIKNAAVHSGTTPNGEDKHNGEENAEHFFEEAEEFVVPVQPETDVHSAAAE